MSSDQRPAVGGNHDAGPENAPEDAHPQATRTAAAWEPTDKSRCFNCAGHVTSQFRKSLGDDNNAAHACPSCVDKADIYNGAAADPHYEKRVQKGEQNGGDPAVEEEIRRIGGGGR